MTAAPTARAEPGAPLNAATPPTGVRREALWTYLFIGIAFGIVITRAEVISWWRIQEMFRLQSFHMYGVFATALPTAIGCVQFLKRRARTMAGAALAAALLSLPLLLVTDRADIWLIIAVAVVVNSAIQVTMNAATAALPVVVGTEQAGPANSVKVT